MSVYICYDLSTSNEARKQDGDVCLLCLLTAFPYGAFVLASRDHRHRVFFLFSRFLCRYRCQTTVEKRRKKNSRLFFFFSLNVALDTSTKCRKEEKKRREIHVYKNECLLTIQRRP